MDKSYGVHVAKIAGIPEFILNEAEKKLIELEKNSFAKTDKDKEQEPIQISLSNLNDNIIISKIKALDLDDTTPREAFAFLEKIQSEIK